METRYVTKSMSAIYQDPSCRGMASGHLVAISMYVSRNLYPPLAVGIGPTKSIRTLSKGTHTTSLSCMGILFGIDFVCLW